MYCKNCGNEIANAAIMCVKCGVPTNVKSVESADTSKPMTQGELIAGWLGAVFIPLIGVIIGIVAMTRGRIGLGCGMLALSIFMFFFWIGFMQAI